MLDIIALQNKIKRDFMLHNFLLIKKQGNLKVNNLRFAPNLIFLSISAMAIIRKEVPAHEPPVA